MAGFPRLQAREEVKVLVTVLYFFITQDREITRSEGTILLLLYVLFIMNLGTLL